MNTVFLAFSLTNSSISDFYLELAENLSQKNKVIIFTDRLERDINSESIVVLQWPSRRPKNIKDFIFLYQNIRIHKPKTMISVFGSVNVFLIMGFLLNVQNRIAWCHTISSQFKTKMFLQVRKRIIYKLATKIVANSNATKLDLIESFNVATKKIEVVYNAVKRNGITNSPNLNQLVYAGRIHPSKGIDTLLTAISILVKDFPSLKLNILGGNLQNIEIKELKELTLKLGIEKNVFFAGSQNREKVLEAFSKSYLTIVPSLIEAFGYVVIESFSVGTPVIGSNTTGIAEIIRDDVDGYLFEPKDAKELACKVATVLNNPDVREKFSINCYQRFVDTFELKQSANSLSSYLNEL